MGVSYRAGASEIPDDSDLYEHPLLSESLDQVASQLFWTDEASLLDQIRIHESIRVDDRGVVTRFSGVEPLVVEYGEVPESSPEPVFMGPYVDARLEEHLSLCDPAEILDLGIVLRSDIWDAGLDFYDALDRAMIRGEILTWGDVRAFRQEHVDARRARGEEALAPLLSHIAELGGQVQSYSGLSGVVSLRLPVGLVRTLAAFGDVGSVELSGVPENDETVWVTGPTIDGVDLEDLIQSTQFYDAGYYGIDTIGQIEAGLEGGASWVYKSHVGFKPGSSGDSRYFNCLWNGAACVISDPDPNSLHADVDVLRATAWWYDHRHDSHPNIPNDRVTLRIVDGNNNFIDTDGGSDNRRRIHLANPTTGIGYSLQFYGADVTSDEEGCGDNGTRVYYAYFYEDSDARPAGIREE